MSPSRLRPLAAAATVLALLLPASAHAVLAVGAAAPDFTADAAVGGRPFRFRLAEALKQGPVVLYFYPKAFTRGCTVEAHLFAEAAERFQAVGATVIGMSNDDIDTLKRFSVEACRSKFAVAADAGGQVIRDYDVALRLVPGTMADRVSYLIAPDGRIAAVHASLDPDGHIDAMLQAARRLQK
ncbi:MAG: peroxiredoxin [Roseateles sp.]|uniref:peroxiredoxin n=1 Tax=Roseateles sp. TaxID=1971397 RepID=UPI0039E90499